MRQKIFNLGINLSFLTGTMIILNSLIYFIKYIRGSLGDILNLEGANTLLPVFYLVPSLGIWIGSAIIVLTKFGLQKRLKWVWFLFIAFIILVSIPTLMAQILFNITPIAVYTLMFAIPAAAFTGPHIISDDK